MKVQIYRNLLPQNNTRNHLDKISKIFKKILPIYWAFLTYMLLRPGVENIEYSFMFDGIDKVLHLAIFGMLGFSFVAAFPKVRFLYFFQIMLSYSILTEILQDEMGWGRSMEALDLVADTIGVILGYFLFKKVKSINF